MHKNLKETIIHEKKIIFNHEPITIEKTKIIIEQLKEFVCKIKIQNKEATGFFCNINYKNEPLTVLITADHSFNNHNNENMLENMIRNKEKIILSLNDDRIEKEIDFSSKRMVYRNKTYDTTIIEILHEIDKIKKNDYLSLDENIYHNSVNYKLNSVYVLQYPDGKEASVSYGIIKDIDRNNGYIFTHLCSTKTGSSGAPVLNLKTNKIIGIHSGEIENKDLNGGYFLKEAINEFQQGKNLIKIIDKPTFQIKETSSIYKFNNYINLKLKKPPVKETSTNPKKKIDFPKIDIKGNSRYDKDNSPENNSYKGNYRKKKSTNKNNLKTINAGKLVKSENFPNIYKQATIKDLSINDDNSNPKKKTLNIKIKPP